MVSSISSASTIVAIMGGVERRGVWHVPEVLRVVTLMGGCELDFRQAQIPAGGAHVIVVAIMGGVKIIVPDSLAVQCNGVALMGGFEQRQTSISSLAEAGPVLTITGFALMGGVAVISRPRRKASRRARS